MERLTFKDYLITKDQLRTALNETPYKVAKYRVTKYCKLELAESAEVLSMKPNHELIVEWLYQDMSNPTPQSIVLMTKESNSMIKVKMTHSKFNKWVSTYCEAVD